MTPLIIAMVLNLFWFSLAVVGAATLMLAKRLVSKKTGEPFFEFMTSTHPLVALLIALGVGMALFAPLLVPAFLLEWPLAVLTGVYCFVLLAATGYLVWHRGVVLGWVRRKLRKVSRPGLVCGGVVALVLALDAYLALQVGGPMFGDAYVHIAKINQLAAGHFTLADPMLGNGIIESRYHINILLSLNALAASIFNISAIDVWVYSLPFWRFLLWISLFAIAWIFLPKGVRRWWSYAVLIAVPFLYSFQFFYADYPDRVVLAWVVIFIIGLKVFIEKKNAALAILGCVLIAFTQPLMALIAGGFLGLLAGALWLLRKFSWQQIVWAGVGLAILAASVLYTMSFPNRMSAQAVEGIPQIALQHFGPITLALPVAINLNAVEWILLGASFVAYGYLIVRARGVVTKVLLALLVIYYGLIVYNPVLLHFVDGKVPLWVLYRFQEFNVLAYIAGLIGLLILARGLGRLVRKHWVEVAVSVGVVAGLLWYGAYAVRDFVALNKDFDNTYAELIDLQSAKAQLQDQRVLAHPIFTQFRLPAIIKTNVLNIIDWHASPMANMESRWACGNVLASTLQLADLQAAGVTRIITNRYYDPLLADLATTRSFLTLVATPGENNIYAVPEPREPVNVSSVCTIPYGQ